MPRPAWTLATVLFAALPLVAQDKPAAVGAAVEVQFTDGSVVKLAILDEKFDIATRYGRLTVPVADIRRIDLGVRYPEGSLAKIEDAIRRLGDSDFKKRESASAELLAFRELAYPHVRRATSGGSAESVKRAKALLEDLKARVPEEKLAIKELDTVVTADFPISGRIETAAFKGRSPLLGDVEVKLVQARLIRRLGVGTEASLTLDASKFGLPQATWFDTGFDVSGDRMTIQATGTIDVMPQNPGQFNAGPDGLRQNVGARGDGQPVIGPPGALVGRVGNGAPFLVGSRYEGAPGEGRLFLRLESSPWRVPMTGNFSVKIVSGN